ncbi:MAG: ABC transporter permease subunit, partial [Acidobacteriota bacterium]|nr:ABC transporter permease subunit [Acidobacteriota bacterium]
LSMVVLLALVAIGLPLLSGGRGGIGVFVGPTAGYLLGWILGAFVVGLVVHAGGRRITWFRTALGVVVGGIIGYFVGRVDLIGMRLIEIFEAIPTLFLLITIVAFFGRNLYLIMAIIGLTGWTGDARFVRAEFLRLRKQDFVQAAVAAGLPTWSIIFRHMLPNGVAPVLVSASFGVAAAILTESALSFLGLGVPLPTASWGSILSIAHEHIEYAWWLVLFPGVAIFTTVAAFNIVGERTREALDPRSE